MHNLIFQFRKLEQLHTHIHTVTIKSLCNSVYKDHKKNANESRFIQDRIYFSSRNVKFQCLHLFFLFILLNTKVNVFLSSFYT